MPFHLIEGVRQQMLAAFFQSIHCELTVVSVLLTTLIFVPDNNVTTPLLLPIVTD